MTICYYEPVAHIKSAAHELKFRYRRFALRGKCLLVTAALNRSSAFIHLRFRITQWTAGSSLHIEERTSDQADTAAIIAAQFDCQRKAVTNLSVGTTQFRELLVCLSRLFSRSFEVVPLVRQSS